MLTPPYRLHSLLTNQQTTNQEATIMNKSLKAPRPLTTTEIDSLRSLLKNSLNITSNDDEEDATNLLEYAFDMIEADENVGHIADEVSFF